MKQYLLRASNVFRSYRSAGSNNIVIAIGNEAADADSVISALCMGYLRQSIADQSSVLPPRIYIPVISVPRQDFALRRDIEILLNMVDLSLNDVLSLHDICREPSCDVPHLILCDHNKASDQLLQRLGTSANDVVVEEIVDHHVDMNAHYAVVGSNRNIAFDADRNAALVGSACTLVAEYYRACDAPVISADIAVLLMGVIALDTINMDPATAKGTPRDLSALDYLEDLIQKCQGKVFPSRAALFGILSGAKTDISFWMPLSAANCLRLDFKKFDGSASPSLMGLASYGVSSVLLSWSAFMNKADIIEAITNNLVQNGTGLLFVMTLVASPSPRREVVMYSMNKEVASAIDQYILSNEGSTSNFQFEPLCSISELDDSSGPERSGSRVWWKAYSQGNVKCSRKQFAPFMTDYLSKL